MTQRLRTAIDGPSAAGKGTPAEETAAHFGLPHLVYRPTLPGGAKAEKTGWSPVEVAALLPSDLADPEPSTDVAGASCLESRGAAGGAGRC